MYKLKSSKSSGANLGIQSNSFYHSNSNKYKSELSHISGKSAQTSNLTYFLKSLLLIVVLPFIASIGQPSSSGAAVAEANNSPLRIKLAYFTNANLEDLPYKPIWDDICDSEQFPAEWGTGKFDIIVYAFSRKFNSFKDDIKGPSPADKDDSRYSAVSTLLRFQTQTVTCDLLAREYDLQIYNEIGVFKLVVFTAKFNKDWEIFSILRDPSLTKLFKSKSADDIEIDKLEKAISQLHIRNRLTGEMVDLNLANLPCNLQLYSERKSAFRYIDMSRIEPAKGQNLTEIYIGNFNTRKVYYRDADRDTSEQGAAATSESLFQEDLDEKENYDLYLEYSKAVAKGRKSKIKSVDEFEIIKKAVPNLLRFANIKITQKKDTRSGAGVDLESSAIDKEGNSLWVDSAERKIAPSKTIRCLLKQNKNSEAANMKYKVNFVPEGQIPFNRFYVTAAFKIWPAENIGQPIYENEMKDAGDRIFTPLSIYFDAKNAKRLAKKCGPERKGWLRVKLPDKPTICERELPKSSRLGFGYLLQYYGEQKIVDIVNEKQGIFGLTVELVCRGKENVSGQRPETVASVLRGAIDRSKGEEVKIGVEGGVYKPIRDTIKAKLEEVILPKKRTFQRFEIVLRNYDEDSEVEANALLMIETKNALPNIFEKSTDLSAVD